MTDQAEAQRLLSDALKRIATLRSLSCSDSKHVRWLLNTTQILNEVFGSSSQWSWNFREISWTFQGTRPISLNRVGMTPNGRTLDEVMEARHHEAYLKGLDIAEGILQSAIDELQRVGIENVYCEGADGSTPAGHLFVDPGRITELKSITSPDYDLKKLIKLCEELNVCSANRCLLAVAMLTRSILDHVPPIFGVRTFSDVVNNYSGSKSFKESMQHLDKSSRKIADHHLHVQIRKSETLPNTTQVSFSNDLDMLLAEIVRVLK